MNDLVKTQSFQLCSWAEVKDLAFHFKNSGYFPDLRGKDISSAVVKIVAGQELGIGPMTAMQNIYLQVGGKFSMSAGLIAAIVKRSGKYNFKIIKHSETECVLDFYEDGERVGSSPFTIDDAKRANLSTGKNANTWKFYPRNMLFARALTNGAKWYCPDLFAGASIYTPEEVSEEITTETLTTEFIPSTNGEVAGSVGEEGVDLNEVDELLKDLGMTWEEVKDIFRIDKDDLTTSEVKTLVNNLKVRKSMKEANV